MSEEEKKPTSENFDSIYFPVTGLDDRQLVDLLKKARKRSVMYGHQSMRLSYQDGEEISKKGHHVLVHANPDLTISILTEVVNRIDCLVSTADVKAWLRGVGKGKSGKRTLALALSFIEVLRRHDNENTRWSKKTDYDPDSDV